MNTKLRIDLSQGVIDVEGTPDLVREVYSDFRNNLLNLLGNYAQENPDKVAKVKQKVKSTTKPKRAKRKKVANDESDKRIDANSPKLDKDLDLSGLLDFYKQFKPKNNAEKILIFLKYLVEKLEIELPNTDQVFTCYRAVNEKLPTAFSQAFRHASSRNGFIDYNSPTDIVVTMAGNNHFSFDLKKNDNE